MKRIKRIGELAVGEYGLTKIDGKPECLIRIDENNGSTIWYKVLKDFDGRGIQFSELYKLTDAEALTYKL